MTVLRPFPTPVNEAARSDVAKAMCSHTEEPLFDEVAEIVREAFGTPVALVTLIDSENSEFISHVGTDIAIVPKDFSLCAQTFVTRSPLVIPDTHADPRWAKQPVVTNPPHVRFYAGVPVILSGGFAIGTVCAVDLEPRDPPTEAQMHLLSRLARVVARAHELPIEPDAAASAALQAAQRAAQDEFLALVSHELRTPLNAVLGVAHLLELPEAERDLAEALVHGAEHLSMVVENVLAFTEMRSGEMTLDEGEVDVDELLDGVVVAFRALAAARGKRLVRGPSRAGRLGCDAAKLELAVACLISNMVLHGGAEAEIDARRTDDGQIVIEARDDGAGINPTATEAAFRAFSHAGSMWTRAADGLGLGLPMTQRLAALHGGDVAVDRREGWFVAQIVLPSFRAL